MKEKICDSRKLMIQNSSGVVTESEIVYYIIYDSSNVLYKLEFESPAIGKLSFINQDLFECLKDLRKNLQLRGYIALCNGARLDVRPSAMSRDMSGGIIAYILDFKLRRDRSTTVTVDIFDYAEPSLIASVEDQFKYYASQFDMNRELKIRHSKGLSIVGMIHENKVLNPNVTKFTSSITPHLDIAGKNAFERLTKIRYELEKYDYYLLCNGARLDAYPLPSDITTYGGHILHILTHGQIPNQDDFIWIYGDVEPEMVVSIEEQRRNYELWLDSIKSLPVSNYSSYYDYDR
jgi:hypothetical protein